MDNIDPNDPTREDYEAAWEDWPELLGDNSESQELPAEDCTGNALGELRVTFIDRRGDSTRRGYPIPMTETELDDFWRKEWTLSRSNPAYIINPRKD